MFGFYSRLELGCGLPILEFEILILHIFTVSELCSQPQGMSFDPWLVVKALGCSRNLIVLPSLKMTSSCGLYFYIMEPLMDLSGYLFHFVPPNCFSTPFNMSR
jgi:hypothetical protein